MLTIIFLIQGYKCEAVVFWVTQCRRGWRQFFPSAALLWHQELKFLLFLKRLKLKHPWRSRYSFISPVSSEGGTNWVSTVTISLWACSPKNFAMFRICGRLPTAENNRFPTAESSFLYSFVFVFGPSHSRSQAERYLWNRVACSDTKKICVCLWFILFYVSTQCFHACWHVYLIHISHAHSAWLKTSSKPRSVKRECSSHFLSAGVCIGFQGSLKGESYLTPPQPPPPP